MCGIAGIVVYAGGSLDAFSNPSPARAPPITLATPGDASSGRETEIDACWDFDPRPSDDEL